jgi:FHS family L-fucose permease-like MFS transporter
LAPLIGGWLIFGQADAASAVRLPYLGLALVLVLIAVLVQLSPLPEPPKAERIAGSNALRHPQLRWGMVAIFCYVGAEVAVGSLIISFLNLDGVMGLSEEVAKHYLSLYWGGAMAGRFIGAVALNQAMPPVKRLGMMLAIGAAIFALLMVLNATGPVSVAALWPMALLIVANIAVAMLAKGSPGRTMSLFALVAVLLLVGVVAGQGPVALWSIVAIGLFNSILWSNIFTLSIDGLGHDTAQGSSLLVMMILGGALVPWVQASIIDLLSTDKLNEQAFHLSFLLPLACYAYLVWYGLRGSTLRSNV